jgi:hypothetical protein
VHRTSANEPDFPCAPAPNKQRVGSFQQTNKDASNWKYVLPSYKDLRINDAEGWTDECAPHVRTIPPPAAQAFGEAAEKINETQVKLKNPTPKTEKLWIFRPGSSQSAVERIAIWQRR